MDIRTGMFMFLYNNNFQATLFKGPADDLINLSATIGSLDLDLQVNSAVFTYERLNHKLSLYFNGVFLSSIIAPASFVDDVIDWSTADNIYVNQSYRFNIQYPTQYHKISVYDKILTQNEIVDIYDEAQPPPPPPPTPFGSSTIDFSSLDQPTLDSIGSGWTEIKYLPGTATEWFPGNETWEYTFTEFLFTRGDFSAWIICRVFIARVIVIGQARVIGRAIVPVSE
jgi:hypothetical protein